MTSNTAMPDALREAGVALPLAHRVWHLLQTMTVTAKQAGRQLNADETQCNALLGDMWQRGICSRVARTEHTQDRHGATRKRQVYLYAMEPKYKGEPYPQRGEMPGKDPTKKSTRGKPRKAQAPAPAPAAPPASFAPVIATTAPAATAFSGEQATVTLRLSDALYRTINELRAVLAQRFGFVPTFEQAVQHVLTDGANRAKDH